jgi:signal peptidase I
MLTLSIVDIDKEESGEPRVHFLIKRGVGISGDRFVADNGNMRVLFAGEDTWVSESDYISSRGRPRGINRLVDADQYPVLEAAGQTAALNDMGHPVSDELYELASRVKYMSSVDFIAHEKARIEMLRKLSPADRRYSTLLARHNQGWYISEGRIFPLGDNRDNSRDGRFFGPVRMSRVLGRGMIIYWPFSRAGKIL